MPEELDGSTASPQRSGMLIEASRDETLLLPIVQPNRRFGWLPSGRKSGEMHLPIFLAAVPSHRHGDAKSIVEAAGIICACQSPLVYNCSSFGYNHIYESSQVFLPSLTTPEAHQFARPCLSLEPELPRLGWDQSCREFVDSRCRRARVCPMSVSPQISESCLPSAS